MSEVAAARAWVSGLLAAQETGASHRPPGAALWPAIVRVADRERLLTGLAAALLHRRELPLPAGLEPFLASILARARDRNATLRCELVEAVAILGAIGVRPALLKGAIRLVDGLYADPGTRFLGDLDLLVPEDRLAEAQAAMLAVGCRERRPGYAPPADAHHAPPLVRDGWPVPVELHRRLTVEPFASLLPPDELWARATSVDLGGAAALVPARDDQLLHLVVHAMIHHGGHAKARFPLGHLFEGWLVLRADGADAAAAFLDRLDRLGHAGLGVAWLARTAELFGDPAVCPPGGRLSGRMLLTRVRAQGRWPWLEWTARVPGHYAHALHRATHSRPRRHRLLRGLVDPAFWARRGNELWRLLRQP